MTKLKTTTAKRSARGIVLVAAALMGFSVNRAEAYPGLTTRATAVIVVRSDQPEKLSCTVSQPLPLTGASGVILRIKVPRDRTLKSVLLKTQFGEQALEVTGSMPLVGEYEAFIDNQKSNCATSGTLFMDVEGTLGTKTVTCPGILLPGLGARQSCGDVLSGTPLGGLNDGGIRS